MKAGGGGVVSGGEVVAPVADLLQRESKRQQVGTHGQSELQQKAAEEVVLGLLTGHGHFRLVSRHFQLRFLVILGPSPVYM